ncbi:PQQ-binding-like beta-propeller repeat protein [Phenylobacterium sp.]|uniref:PQQ-like beta-propeller repeat protein n=1 Tax=Phenylobacterium sp. TaxID=1871053 RepID=UPI003919978F
MRRNSLFVLLLTAAVAIGGCQTVNRFNPFSRDDEPQEVASEGERIAIVADGQQLEVSEALQGADFFLPTPTPMSEWPVPGGNLEQAVGHAEGGGNLSVVWRRDFGQGSKGGHHVTAPPVAAGGKIFVMDGEARVSAFDAQSGSQVWSVNLKPDGRRDREAFGGGLAVAGGKLYVSSGYRFMAQLDANTGAVGWRTNTEQPLHAAPTVSGGRAFVVAIDNTLLTFDTATGEAGWTYQALTEPARILKASSPAVSGDTVVASFGSGELVALRAANGNDLWSEALSQASRSNALSEIRDIPGRPAIYQGDVFAVSHSGVFSATDLRTGQPRWSLPVTGITTPWPAGDVVYVVSKSGEVICAARESGQIYWIRDLGEGRESRRGRFFGLGTRHFSVRPIWSSPLLVSNRLLVAGSTGELVVLNPKTGAVERTINLGAPTLIGPIAAGGTVYVVTDQAQLIALR